MNTKLSHFISSLLGIFIGTSLVVGGNQIGIIKLQAYNNSSEIITTKLHPVSTAMYSTASDISNVAKRLTPAVVGITSSTNLSSNSKDRSGMGSGIIADINGYILTNNHVASKDAEKIKVFLYDGRIVKGKVIWADPSLDISIVKINADNLTAAPLGDSEVVMPGDAAIAIGNPLGLTFQRTVTSGIISATNRAIGETGYPLMDGLLQTDASINPGNSGGPLINIKGEVIGINTIKVTTAEGMSFAIPINITKPILKSILQKGTFHKPTIGINGLDKQMALLNADKEIEKGIYVNELTKDGPAYKSGIKRGDTIIAVNNQPVNTLMQLRYELFNAGSGSSVTIKIKKNIGEDKDIVVKLL